jgi:hypothetical protein
MNAIDGRWSDQAAFGSGLPSAGALAALRGQDVEVTGIGVTAHLQSASPDQDHGSSISHVDIGRQKEALLVLVPLAIG